jgi:nucleotide sugar dehydrogenase
MMQRIGIVGYGIVGRSVHHVFADFCQQVTVYDKFQDTAPLEEAVLGSDVVFICVPTPCDFSAQSIDLGIMDEVIGQVAELDPGERIIAIKSTVVPGTTATYADRHPELSLAMVPEFLREATYLQDAEKPDRVAVGSNQADVAERLCALYRKRFPYIPVIPMKAMEAELLKYMSNCFLAMKVMFGNVFRDYAQAARANYQRVKGALTVDPRIPDDHLDVTEARGFGGKCLPKDLNAMIGWAEQHGCDTELLQTVWQQNLDVRNLQDWETIPGAAASGEDRL